MSGRTRTGRRARPSRSPTRSARSWPSPSSCRTSVSPPWRPSAALREAGVDRPGAAEGGRPDGGDRHPPGVARRARADAQRLARRGWVSCQLVEQEQPRRSDRHDDPERPLSAWRAARPAGRRSCCSWAAWSRRARTTGTARAPAARTARWRSPWSPGRRARRSSRSSTTSVSCGAMGSWERSCCGAPARPTRSGRAATRLTTNMTFDEALAVLSTPPPPVPTARLTIPEGYRLTQIAERVQRGAGHRRRIGS